MRAGRHFTHFLALMKAKNANKPDHNNDQREPGLYHPDHLNTKHAVQEYLGRYVPHCSPLCHNVTSHPLPRMQALQSLMTFDRAPVLFTAFPRDQAGLIRHDWGAGYPQLSTHCRGGHQSLANSHDGPTEHLLLTIYTDVELRFRNCCCCHPVSIPGHEASHLEQLTAWRILPPAVIAVIIPTTVEAIKCLAKW